MNIRRKIPKVRKAVRKPEIRRKVSDDIQTRKFVEDIVAFLDNKKMQNIVVFNLEDINPYFGLFVLATATSILQLSAVSREFLKAFGEKLDEQNRKIAPPESGWVIFDFIDVVVHLFLPEQRNYYNLEKLWGDAPVIYTYETKLFRW